MKEIKEILSKNIDEKWHDKGVEEQIRYYLKLLKISTILESVSKELNKHISLVDHTIALDIIERDPEFSIEVEGIKFKPTISENFALDKSKGIDDWNSEPVFNFFIEQGEGAVIKIKKEIHHQTRNSILKILREKGINLPDFVKITFYEHLDFNKSKVSRSVE